MTNRRAGHTRARRRLGRTSGVRPSATATPGGAAGGPAIPDDASLTEPPHPEPTLEVVDFPELPALVNYVRQRRCTLFVGAGLSRGAGLPTWRQLMEGLAPEATPFAAAPQMLARLERSVAAAERLPGPEATLRRRRAAAARVFRSTLGDERARRLLGPHPSGGGPTGAGSIPVRTLERALKRVKRDTTIAVELEKLLKVGKFPELAGYCRDLLGREAFHELVRTALNVQAEIPETHQVIVRTPWACIVTTNFDDLLERAYARWDARGIPRAPTGAELAQQGTLLLDGAFFILKAHGDLDDESSIIFTTEDYRRVIHSNPAFQAMLTGILLTRAVLFVGYSLSDPNFRLLLDNQLTIFNEHVPPRYALMEGVGEAEREILWRTAKLRVFSYEHGKHEVVGRFLGTLAKLAEQPQSGRDGTPVTDSRQRLVAPTGADGRAADNPLDTLAIHASGDRMTLELRRHHPGRSPRRIWSGGCQWPDWAGLKQRLGDVCKGGHGRGQLADVSAVGAQLQRVMPQELLRSLDQMAPDTVVGLSLSAETEIIPWEWLIVEGSPLCLRNPVIRRPVGISDKARGLRFVWEPIRALLVGDAGLGDEGRTKGLVLPGASREVQEVAQLIREANSRNFVQILEREDAVYARLVAEVESGDYDIIHFAGHAWYEHSQALLYVWDGRVTSAELSSLLNRRPPALLVLNSHYTSFVPPGVSDDERLEGWPQEAGSERPPGVDRPPADPLGFTRLAARSGVSAYVGSFSGGLSDQGAAAFAVELYRYLLRGAHFALALHSARKATTRVDDTTGLFYAGTGYPGLQVARAYR